MSDVRQPALEILPLESGQGVRVVGELDLATVEEFKEALARLSDNGEVTLELSELTFIDSTGVHAVVEFARSSDGGNVILASPSDSVRRVLEILDLADHPSLTIR